MSYVFDSSALIYLGKLKLLEKIHFLKGRKIIPRLVYEEVVTRGIERKEPEALYIDDLVKNKMFIIMEGKIAIVDSLFLSRADKEVLSIAKQTNSIALIDEMYARNVAETCGIEVHGTVYMILKLFHEKIITKKRAVDYVDKLVTVGFYLSVNKYIEIMKVLK